MSEIPTVPVPSVENWAQAIVTIVLIVAVLVVPSVLAYLGTARVKAVQSTLTENNGGGSVKDSLDRIEGRLGNLDARLSALETKTTTKKRGLFK